MQKENTVVIKKESFDYLALGGRGWHVVPGEGGAVVGQASPALQPCRAGSVNAPAKVHTSHVILNLFQDLHRFFPTRAFTLIELLVVVLIIGILTAVAVPQYQKAVGKARMTAFILQANTIYRAMHFFHSTQGTFPTSMNDLDIWEVGYDTKNREKVVWGNQTWTHTSGYIGTYVNIPGIEKFYCRIWLTQAHATCYAYTSQGQAFLESYGWPIESTTTSYKRFFIMFDWRNRIK